MPATQTDCLPEQLAQYQHLVRVRREVSDVMAELEERSKAYAHKCTRLALLKLDLNEHIAAMERARPELAQAVRS